MRGEATDLLVCGRNAARVCDGLIARLTVTRLLPGIYLLVIMSSDCCGIDRRQRYPSKLVHPIHQRRTERGMTTSNMRSSPAHLLATFPLVILPVIAQGNPGAPCLANDQSATGVSDVCDTCTPPHRDPFHSRSPLIPGTSYCRIGTCSSLPTKLVGESCDRDSQCVGAETYADILTYCAPQGRGTGTTCGGAGADCYSIDGKVTGPSPTCASGTFRSGVRGERLLMRR